MSAVASRASTKYKKQDGILSVTKDQRSITWTPLEPPGALRTVAIAVQDITSAYKANLQSDNFSDGRG
jgi:hypothetical protein